jgi:hypothetical protein
VPRQLEDFITAYLKYVEGTESPTQYHLWCGISAIAAALQRKAYIVWGTETIFPNMYIVLIGPSGKCRKGVAMAIGQDLVRSIGIKVTAESITREALIRDLRECAVSYDDPDKGIMFHCSLTTHSPELSVFLKQKDVAFLADLTDWYDSKSEWTYRTKGQGTDTIQGICFNLLGASAPDWLTSILPEEAIGGGFTSRVIFVVEDEKREVVPVPKLPNTELRLKLKADLERIYVMAGEFRMNKESIEIYSNWYIEHNKNPVITDPKFFGYNERKATHLKKLAIILSASRGDSRVVTVDDFNRALTILDNTEKKMPRVFRSLGKSRYSELTMTVFDFIIEKKVVSRSEILRKFYLDVDDYTLDIIAKTLYAMKAISVDHILNSNEIVYTLIHDGRR